MNLFPSMRVLGYSDANICFRCFSTPYHRMRALLSSFFLSFSHLLLYMLLFENCLSWFGFTMSFFPREHGPLFVVYLNCWSKYVYSQPTRFFEYALFNKTFIKVHTRQKHDRGLPSPIRKPTASKSIYKA